MVWLILIQLNNNPFKLSFSILQWNITFHQEEPFHQNIFMSHFPGFSNVPFEGIREHLNGNLKIMLKLVFGIEFQQNIDNNLTKTS